MEFLGTILLGFMGLGSLDIILVFGSIVFFILMIWCVVNILGDASINTTMKTVWIVALIFVPIFPVLGYFYYRRSRRQLLVK
jgi:RsiW-degrading membrane proteinase PrsW (M82 family)